ncbi:hypothetical protein WA026_023265 [Henosepilachna vigintioctopunctata]|uniref:Kazal-like domain-containing protein n=1 Tax=Henosepilachna vigintioctopunctata TaxID=420089 RepID=A0AAW1UXI5_9CUCU
MLKYYILFTIVLLVHSVTSRSADYISFNGKLSGLERMEDPKLKDCIHRCPVLIDFIPQCASDGRTYPNASSLRCMNLCLKPSGEELTVTSLGFCESDQIPSD